MLFKSLTIPHAGFAAQDIDGSFVSVVLMRIGTSARRDPYDLQMDSPRSYGLRRDTGRTLVSSLSADFRPRTTTRQVGVASSIAMSGITCSFSSVIFRLLLIRRYGY